MLRKCGFVLVLLLGMTGITAAQSGSPLRDMLLPEACEQACYLGITPGITTGELARVMLDEADVIYEYGPGDLDPDTTLYRYLIPDPVDFPYGGPHLFIVIPLFIDTQVIPQLSIVGLEELSVDQVITEFGLPTRIVTLAGGIQLVYEHYLLTFSVVDDTHVDVIAILSPETYDTVYNSEDATDLQPCAVPENLCSITLAVPPDASAGPALTLTDNDNSGSETVTLDGAAEVVVTIEPVLEDALPWR